MDDRDKYSTANAKILHPARVGTMDLQNLNLVVLGPLTRFRADRAHVPTDAQVDYYAHVPTDVQVDYYAQRASVPEALLISEGTFILRTLGELIIFRVEECALGCTAIILGYCS